MAMEAAKPLAFPVPFPDGPMWLLTCDASPEAAAEKLGPPMLTDWVDGLGNADFWAFEFPCGLQVAFEFLQTSKSGRVVADSPEIDHVLRHIPFSASECVRIDETALHSELERLLVACPERKSKIESLHSFQVWRQGDDGNAFRVGDATSERDAKCWVRHLESLGHKQLYWYSPVGRVPPITAGATEDTAG
ncbi:hypothetical protein [Humisphaera borealis]|uniref:Uncharacterized protein n=1 Tax=Humisphaera borealis TaxID=2807512 RepID=A0A7M2X0Q0_9BACT|nr:hypothetical protein [Humisphaera borealis]QOV91265.1 hypothetical protein IPV69_07875 [Humisphaera borealis]